MGACQIFALLKLRHENKLAAGIQVLKPDFDKDKVKLITDEDRIDMLDFRGRFGDRPITRFPHHNIYDTMRDNSHYKHVYLVVSIEIADDQMVTKKRNEQEKRMANHRNYEMVKEWVNPGWYHMFSPHWTPEQAKEWKKHRHRAFIKTMEDFPHLKFVVFRDRNLKWWLKQGFPRDRVIFWPIRWLGESPSSEAGDPWDATGWYKNRMEEMRKNGGFGFHNFPTEDSYNELYDLIIRDADGINF